MTIRSLSINIVTVEHDYDFSPIHERMRFYTDTGILSCCSTLIMSGTDILDYATFGYMDLDTKKPLIGDAIYRMYSNTKIVTSVALMQLVEQGRIGLDDALSKFIPAFAEPVVLHADAQSASDVSPAQNPILVRHVLSHSAGFSYGFIEPDSIIDRTYFEGGLDVLGEMNFDLEEFCARLAKMPLVYEPGTAWRYSVATDVCARLIEIVSGQKFDAYLKQHVFDPLGMQDTDFWVPPDKAHRFITMYAPKDMFDEMKPGLNKADDPLTGDYNTQSQFLSGGGGLVSTMSDYSTFIRMIVNGGEWQGQRILQNATLEAMRVNQLPPGVGVSFPMWDMPGTVFGLGFALKATLGEGEPAGAQDEYHWGGMAGTHSWMAPRVGLTGMCATQRMPGFWHPFSHEFKAAAYEIVS